jgi:hypothetical protein
MVNPKQMKGFFSMLKTDEPMLSEVAAQASDYESELEQICYSANYEHTFSKLMQISSEIQCALPLPRKYSQFSNPDEIFPGIKNRLGRLQGLGEALQRAVMHMAASLEKQWYLNYENVCSWNPEQGVDAASVLRAELDKTTAMYVQLLDEFPQLEPYSNSMVLEYNRMIVAMKQIRTQLNTNVARSKSLQPIREQYLQVVRDHMSPLDKLTGRKKGFEHKELLFEIECARQGAIGHLTAYQDHQYWIQYYEQAIAYLSAQPPITLEHVEQLSEFESPVVYESTGAINGTSQAGQVAALQRALTIQVEAELHRVREHIAAKTYQLGESDPNSDVDETKMLIYMAKLIGEPTAQLRRIQAQLSHDVSSQNIQDGPTNNLNLLNSDQAEYWKLVNQTLHQLEAVGDTVGEFGVIDTSAINCLFQIKEALYQKLSNSGFRTPVAFIENYIRSVHERDIALIAEFAEEHLKAKTTKKTREKSKDYRQIINAWGDKNDKI